MRYTYTQHTYYTYLHICTIRSSMPACLPLLSECHCLHCTTIPLALTPHMHAGPSAPICLDFRCMQAPQPPPFWIPYACRHLVPHLSGFHMHAGTSFPIFLDSISFCETFAEFAYGMTRGGWFLFNPDGLHAFCLWVRVWGGRRRSGLVTGEHGRVGEYGKYRG